MPRPPRLAPLFTLALPALLLATACAGPPIAADVEGSPVCPDFEAGHAKMAGSLRHPVRLRVLEGSTQLFRTVVSGRRHPGDSAPHTFIPDDNATYTIEWAQCANERAPRSATEAAHETPKARDKVRTPETAYDCGEATVYKTDKLVTRKGDKASHVLQFVPPPDAACWQTEAAPAPPPSAAPDPGAAPVDAGAAPPQPPRP